MNTWFNAYWYNDNWFNMDWFAEQSPVTPPDIGGAMATIRQGNGEQYAVSGVAPTDRIDGTPLDPADIVGYNFYMTYEGGTEEFIGMVQLVNGVFEQPIDADTSAVGSWDISYSTVSTNFPQGGPRSNILNLVILAPLAAPNPPTIS